jgi:hypothetical protein
MDWTDLAHNREQWKSSCEHSNEGSPVEDCVGWMVCRGKWISQEKNKRIYIITERYIGEL